ncbi:MAG TPA: SMP-30/gluconolactonase/LRE family protein, partial [Amycolatopsis sp.]|nr:SMP-30/gluconolactonase/LRE family protein [Amycolatopsis sp.]
MGGSGPEPLLTGLGFPECPRWHRGRLWVSDMMTKQVLEISGEGTVSVFADLPNRPGGTGFLADGSMYVVSMQDCRLLRYDSAGHTEVADVAGLSDGWLNDLVVDGRGRAYLGDTKGSRNSDGTVTVTEASAAAPTRIIAVLPGQSPRVVATGMEVANGLVVTPDERTLVVSETVARRLTAFTITDDGSLADRRVFAELPGEMPNGVTADAEGAIWVASHNGCFLRVLDGGEITHRIAAPGGAGCL